MAELYGQRIQTTVKEKYLPYLVDTTLNSNVLFQRVVRGLPQHRDGRFRHRCQAGLANAGHEALAIGRLRARLVDARTHRAQAPHHAAGPGAAAQGRRGRPAAGRGVLRQHGGE